jgi:DNA-directed RNA polymerase specialized sigma24 family protein
MNVRKSLMGVRNLRLLQYGHANIAAEYLHRAGRGMTSEQARNIGGTGNFPLTDNADDYDWNKRLAAENKTAADAAWEQVKPLMQGLAPLERRVIELYYNACVAREDMPELVGKARPLCDDALHRALGKMEARQ